MTMRIGIVCVALGGVTAARATPAQRPAHSAIDWPVYAHDAGGSRFSPAAQITRANVGQLVPVWTYRTGDFALGDGMTRDETTPLFVDGLPLGGVRDSRTPSPVRDARRVRRARRA